MRPLTSLLACLLMVMTAWSTTARAAEMGCGDMAQQVAIYVAADCDEVPADADKGYPHCHTGCHGHHVAAPLTSPAPGQLSSVAHAYDPAVPVTMAAHQVDRDLRPPRA